MTGEYSGIIVVQIPGSTTRLQLTVKNALYLFFYCYAKSSLNIDPVKIPKIQVHHIPKTKSEVESKEYLKGLTLGKHYTENEFNQIYEFMPI